MSAMQDMTKGGAAGHLLRYAVPLMLGNWFQLAYNAVDSIIAGRFIGKDALAAEGIAGPVMNLVILGITGVCLGAGVLMSEFFGAKDGESLRRELATTVLSGTAACTVVALLGVLFTPAILEACAVPREIFAITAIYLRITFLGGTVHLLLQCVGGGVQKCGRCPNAAALFDGIGHFERSAGPDLYRRAGLWHCMLRHDNGDCRSVQCRVGRVVAVDQNAGTLPPAGPVAR